MEALVKMFCDHTLSSAISLPTQPPSSESSSSGPLLVLNSGHVLSSGWITIAFKKIHVHNLTPGPVSVTLLLKGIAEHGHHHPHKNSRHEMVEAGTR